MNIEIKDGVVIGARQVISSNCDERDRNTLTDLLVVHGISLPPGEFSGQFIDDFFTNNLDPEAHPYFAEIKGLRVSAHCLIRRDGEVVQYVPFHKRAWHAGVSEFKGRMDCNDFSIGIELEGTDILAYTPIQYEVLTHMTKALQQIYPGITNDRIVGHCDIAPGRKTDPGEAFDWDYLMTCLQKQKVMA